MFFYVAPAIADSEIICRVKGVGQRIFVLDSGIFSSNVSTRINLATSWTGAQKQTAKNLLGRGTAICKFSGIRLATNLPGEKL